MKIEKLNYGKNKNHKILLYGLISVVLLLLTITLITSRANYKISSNIQLAKGKINYKAPDLNVVAMYINNGYGNYIEQATETTLPKEGYTINGTKSYCYKTNSSEHDNNIKFSTNVLGEHIIENLSRNDKCYLYFDKITYTSKTMSEILEANYSVSTRTSENKDFNVPFGATNYGVVYEAEDDYGTSYYFAGAPLDNWVKFGKQDGKDIWWRIIRINGNGSIRLIYSGTTAPTASQASIKKGVENERISLVSYNLSHDNFVYVGFYYRSNIMHGSETPSNVYSNIEGDANGTSLTGFYVKNIKGQTYETWIDKNVGFCNDRAAVIGNDGTGDIPANTKDVRYAAYDRLKPDTAQVTSSTKTIEPTLKCSYFGSEIYNYTGSDLFTVAGSTDIGSTHGNKALTYPVGLITADEAAYAGLVANSNTNASNYLHTGQAYWTMTPMYTNSTSAVMYIVGGVAGFINAENVTAKSGVRPVINLKADTPLIGNGTYNNPYRLAS